MRLAGLPEYSVDWQHLFCLLHALDDLGVENTRTETVEFIRAKQYLRLAPADREPYPTQTEPRWQTDIAYARKIGVISGLVSYNARDAWGISRPGREVIRALIAKGREIQVHRCFLWSTDFKRTLCPEYRPSVIDLPRPERWTRINTFDPILSSVADTLLSLEDYFILLLRECHGHWDSPCRQIECPLLSLYRSCNTGRTQAPPMPNNRSGWWRSGRGRRGLRGR